MSRLSPLGLPSRSRKSLHAASSIRFRKLVAVSLSLLLALAFLNINSLGQWTSQSTATIDPLATFHSKKTADKNSEFVPGQILVRYRNDDLGGISESQLTSLTARGRQIPARVERFDASALVKGLRLVHVAPDETLNAIEALKDDPNVLYAEPDYIIHADVTANDPQFTQLWGLKNTGQSGGTAGADIDAELAWNTTTGSSNVVVGVVDTGIDIGHPDLTSNIWVNPGESGGGKETNGVDDDGNGKIDDVNGWDFNHNDRTVYDGPAVCTDSTSDAFNDPVDEHGTHVAGTIGASGNNGVGVTGINWQVKIMPLKFLGPCGSGPSSAALSGINYAVAMRSRGVNIRVLSNSWGGGGFSQSLLNGIQAANSAGILFVAAAGNESTNNDQAPHYPSNYNVPNVISVASTTRTDGLSSFSNFGPNTVHVAAPGSSILSTTPGNTYSTFSGTSMATPHVSGVAALICAAFPNITLQQLRAALIYSGDSLPILATRTVTGRRLNAALALQSAADNDTTPPGAINDLHITSQTGRNVTLGWTATGDDGASGRASLYDISFIDASDPTPTALTKLVPATAGSQETVSISIPYRHVSGSIRIRTFDNLGNEGAPANVSITVSTTAAEPYTVTESAASGLSTGGTALGLNDDDAYRTNYQLPFSFPYYGQSRTSVTISTNGALYFFAKSGNDAGSSVDGLDTQAMIAGLWDDLRTDRLGGDVFVVQPSANRIIFRWKGSTFADETQPINFEIELRSDGTILTRYGSGNAGITPVVGISGGEPDAYVVDSHTSQSSNINLADAQTVLFTPRSSSSVTCPATAMTVGQSLSRSLSNSDCALSDGSFYDAYTFSGTAGQQVSILMTATLDAYLILLKPDGSELTHDDDGAGGTDCRIPAGSGFVTLPTTGTYTILANSFSPGETGPYTLTLNGNGPSTPMLQLKSSSYGVPEGAGYVIVVVERTDNSADATIDYATSDTFPISQSCQSPSNGIASSRCDYATTIGILRFAAGETTKNIIIPIVDDNIADGDESFSITLSNPTGGGLGTTSTATVTILEDANTAGNPVDAVPFFVRQHYIDLLGRLPDQLESVWQGILNNCPPSGKDANGNYCDRIEVSSAFFRSEEFQSRGYFVYRLYSTVGKIPLYEQYMPDFARVSGFLSAQQLEANKVALVNNFTTRSDFQNKYGGVTAPAAYVDALLQTVGLSGHSSRQSWIDGLTSGSLTRAQVFRAVAETTEVYNKYYNEAFVIMQYFGYLRRTADGSYLGWIQTMNQTNGDYRTMINGFLNSAEYRQRFGP